MKRMAGVTAGFEEQGDEEKVTLVLDEGCRDLKAGNAIEGTWRKRFCSPKYVYSWPGLGLLVSSLHLLLCGMSILICFNTIYILSC